jgi:hypothetical protein
MGDERLKLVECPRVEEQVQPLASRQLAFGVLPRHPVWAAACASLLPRRTQFEDAGIFRRHGSPRFLGVHSANSGHSWGMERREF